MRQVTDKVQQQTTQSQSNLKKIKITKQAISKQNQIQYSRIK
jgi:hypothetical protein